MTLHLDAVVIDSEQRLSTIEADWWRLWERSPGATPFQSPAWLLAWWRAFHPGLLAVIAVRAGDRLVGLAPMYVEQSHARRRLLPIGIALSDYLDVLVEPQVRTRVLAKLAAVCTSLDCDEWELPHLAPDAVARGIPAPQVTTEQELSSEPCPVLVFDQCGSGALTSVPAGMRRKLRMARHRAERARAHLVARDERDTAWWSAAVVWLVRARETRRAGDWDPRLERFLSDAVAGLCSCGLARVHALLIGGDLAGVYFGFHAEERSYAYQAAFDPAFAYFSPGTLLIGAAIEEAVGEGAREFDFLRGRETYKYRWGAIDRVGAGRRFVLSRP